MVMDVIIVKLLTTTVQEQKSLSEFINNRVNMTRDD